jgi:CRISPR/Cas system-associated endoribonuclease Cas2
MSIKEQETNMTQDEKRVVIDDIKRILSECKNDCSIAGVRFQLGIYDHLSARYGNLVEEAVEELEAENASETSLERLKAKLNRSMRTDTTMITVSGICKRCHDRFEKELPKHFVDMCYQAGAQGFTGTCPACTAADPVFSALHPKF